MSGLWSVITLKCGRPARNILHFRVAQVTASSSSSMTAYRDSGSVRKRDPAWIRVQVLSAVFCCRTKPRPCLLASVHRRVGLLASKKASVGAVMRDSLAVENARSWSVDQMKSFFVLRRGRSGAKSAATVSVLAKSWLTSPKKERRSVRLVGVGNLAIASVNDWSMW